ncbi:MULTISPECIES: FtsH protease modulator YccA [Edwardsiella]|uniref:FtsH protease modulator YccA n=2 Tax=Edwardsiella anguillarum TaxID=1821960 RepID=A0ABY8SHG7_9GAMM|nr:MULTISPECIES: FtsH protease modulator YccA [Edwardsiella]AKM48248.1 membrane protein [Edwardsiella sp. EA181011]GAJ66567.1 putative TEGT family carrier/transport protein [Edwardsiella piscicida]AIJ09662.1 Putative TEGT family carrier/transport protein [Edwardsiella anguillarum ET080813]AKR77401.1 FtsH protease modulator YccA [Edwardsiella sp. LADL05-105]KAB0592626.1 FtsH protease modulator YccA [Edwardsiella anguillarum]
MDRIVVSSTSARSSLLSTHKVLRNTYFLLALTLAFSALTATVSTVLMLPAPGLLLMLVGFYGLMFLTYRLADRPAGLLAVFALTGFMGYTLGPILSSFIASGAGDLIMLALGGTALVFFCCSAYVLTTRKDMSFLSGMMMAGFVVLLLAVVANLFLQLPALSLAISALFILFSTGAILWETSNIIHGGETNYIRATVGLYVSLYNLFISLLSLLGFARSN